MAAEQFFNAGSDLQRAHLAAMSPEYRHDRTTDGAERSSPVWPTSPCPRAVALLAAMPLRETLEEVAEGGV